MIPFAGGANAAPVSPGSTGAHVTEGMTLVHGRHRSCTRGYDGWHRHERIRRRGPDRYVRRRCHTWHGRGRRPNHCVRVGPVLICDN
jgi:hypothetical protein